MELNWSTFVLEILNFLILVWILKHFLYQPVLGVIARRRAGIEQSVQAAKTLQAEAENLKARYEGRLAEWDRERAQAREQLAGELEQERATRQAQLATALDQEREKARVGESRRLDDIRRRYTEAALAQGARFAARLLEHAAGAETEAHLAELLLDELGRLPPERLAALRNSHATAPAAALVRSAFPLPDKQRQRLQQVLTDICGKDTGVEYVQDPALVAGLHITIGAWVLAVNIRDELSGFAELSHVE
ncbi:MAG: F0F1 ATP synthase subunit delta [Pseudomonadota bacterium]